MGVEVGLDVLIDPRVSAGTEMPICKSYFVKVATAFWLLLGCLGILLSAYARPVQMEPSDVLVKRADKIKNRQGTGSLS